MLGAHWIADALDCTRERLTRAAVHEALIQLPARLSLTRVGEPQLFQHMAPDGGPDTVAGIVLIAESHVSLHCFPGERSLHIDIFSCKEMDLDVARRYIQEHFGAARLLEKTLERGRDETMAPRPSVRVRRAR